MTKEERQRRGGFPVDRGWAWVCVIGAAISLFILVGTMKSAGIFFVEFKNTFQTSSSMTGWMMGLLSAGLSVGSPIATALGRTFTYRAVVMCGSALLTFGSILTAFMTDGFAAIIVYGIFTGTGFALMFSPSLVIVGHYFEKRRSLANGLIMAGGAIGQLTIPQLVTYLFREYSFQGAMLVYAGLNLHGFVAGALMRPISFYQSKSEQENFKQKSSDAVKESTKEYEECDEKMLKSINHDKVRTNLQYSKNSKLLAERKELKPEVLRDGHEMKPLMHQQCHDVSATSQKVPEIFSNTDDNQLCSVSYPPEQVIDKDPATKSRTSDVLTEEPAQTIGKDKISVQSTISDQMDEVAERILPACTEYTEVEQEAGYRNTTKEMEVDCDGINHSGNSKAHHWCFLSDFCLSLFNPDLKRVVYVVYVIGLSSLNIGYINPFQMTPPHGRDIHMDKYAVALLLSITGCCDLVGRLFGGWISDFGFLPRNYIMALCLLMSGSTVFICSFVPTQTGLFVTDAMLGIFGGWHTALMVPVLVDAVGLDLLSSGFGLALFFVGLTAAGFPSIFGAMRDAYGSYQLSFTLCGVFLLIGSICMSSLAILKKVETKWRSKREEQAEDPTL